MGDRDAILARIRALLAKTVANGCTEAEAVAAAELAAKLLAKHNLTLDEAELEWVAEPDSQSLDDDFLNEFSEAGELLELEPLGQEHAGLNSAGKLEQAQTCIDDGDLDSAIELLNELLKDGDEPLKQTARTLLAGIR